MPFPTVKSDPYKRKRPRKRHRVLWPDSVWKRLVELAVEEHAIGPRTLLAIREANMRLGTDEPF
jgi:hypothetical protein